MSDTPCPICAAPATIDWFTPIARAGVDCHVCGTFEITKSFDDWWKMQRESNGGRLPSEDEALLPYLSAATRQSAQTIVLGDVDWTALAIEQRRTPVSVKIRRLLRWIAEESETYGAWVATDQPSVLAHLAARDDKELKFLLNHLRSAGAIEEGSIHTGVSAGGFALSRPAARLTVHGWETISPLPGRALGTCFVAMSFDPTLNEAFHTGMLAAIENDCGFTAVRVDRVEHNDEITDRIIAGIRSAQFVVADFTLHRQGVYYEAGFALGLGLQLVSCCRDTDVAGLHFDTRNRSHVVWSSPDDLRTKLRDRIRATIPGAKLS